MIATIDWSGPQRQACICGTCNPRSKPIMVWTDDGNAFCHCCRETFYRDERKQAGPVRPAPLVRHEPDVDRWKLDRSLEVWAASRTITPDCLVAPYFEARHIALPPADGDWRWLEDLHLFGFKGPVLAGRMTPATDHRTHRGVHLTWLTNGPDGWRRLERRYLGPKKGCVVRLFPDEAVSTGLAIGEGIETMLALAHVYRPVWACMDAGNLADFPVLPGIESLLIAADHDPAGLRAAKACADRWDAAGAEVAIVMARREKSDINDLEHCA